MKMDNALSTSSFNDLKKETIGQTYKNLNNLLNDKSKESIDGLKNLIKTEETLSPFEETLRLMIIDSLRLKDHVVGVLLSQNDHQIKIILNCNWFFTDFISAEELCSKIIPNVSIRTRNKLVGRLAIILNREEAAEKLFNFIKENYSKAQAELFLMKCSSQFIENYFTCGKPLFRHQKSCKILLAISSRFPNHVFNLFDKLLNDPEICFDIGKQSKVLIFLASHHTDQFVPFYEKNYSKLLFLHFGTKLSRKLGPRLKSVIFEKNAVSKSNVFNNSSLIKVFDFNDQIKLLAVLIKSERKKLSFLNWINYAYNLQSLLRKVKPSQRLAMIESVFKQVYNLNLWNYMILCEPKVLEVIPLKQRLPCVKEYEKNVLDFSANVTNLQRNGDFSEGLEDWRPLQNPVEYSYLYPFEEAFPRLKELLSKTPDLFNRQDIVRAMVESCAINKDFENLDELVNYVSVRFRNDSPIIFVQFIDEIYFSFPLKSLSSNVVQKIEEMLHLTFVKSERKNYEYLLEKCMHHRLGSNMDVDYLVKHIVDWRIEDNKIYNPFIHEFNSPKSRELFFKFYSEIMKRIVKMESSNAELLVPLILWILGSLKKFNRKCKEKPICLSHVPDLVPHLITLMKDHSKGIIEDTDITTCLDDPILIDAIETPPNKLIKRTLKRRPRVVLDKTQELLEYLNSGYHNNNEIKKLFSLALRVFSFENVGHKVQSIIVEKFRSNNSIADRKNALSMLSRIQSLEEFEKVVEDYMPKGDKIDVGAAPNFNEIQLLIPALIKNLTPSWKNINFIMKFFKGDFFRCVHASFYVCCYSTRIDRLIPTLLEYLRRSPKDKELSIKKELIRILLNASNFQGAMAVCKQCWDSIDHYSVRTILLKRISSIFLERPTEETFNLLKEFIGQSDEIVIIERPKLNEIPREFFSEYVLALWAVSQRKITGMQSEIQKSVIREIKLSTISLLPQKFCEDIIKNNLFFHNLDVRQLAAYYILADAGDAVERVDFVMTTLKSSSPDAYSVSEFFRILRSTALQHPKFACDMYENLFKKWPYTDPIVHFENRLLFDYNYLYLKITSNVGLTTDQVAKRFGEELKTFYLSHSDLVYLIPIFFDTLKKFMKDLSNQNLSIYWPVIFKELLGGHQNTGLAVLALLALPDDCITLYKMEGRNFSPAEVEERKDMEEIVHTLNGFQSEVVSIYLGYRFGFVK